MTGLMFILTYTASVQRLMAQVNNYLPPSPQAAALARYGEYPVSLATGVPQISIPLYEIKLGNYTLPISISYHASGIKVDDVASPVGLGWVLNAGGVVSRTICGAPDLRENVSETGDTLYRSYDRYTSIFYSSGNAEAYSGIIMPILTDPLNSSYDTSSDRYSYNFATKSGMFRYSYQNRTFVTLNHQPLSILFLYHGSEENNFTIIDSDGIEYIFKDKEKTFMDGTDYFCPTSWYLTDIKTPYGDIHFSYRTAVGYTMRLFSETTKVGVFHYYNDDNHSIDNKIDSENQHSFSYYTYPTLLLTEINWNGNKIQFAYSSDRNDIASERLTSMTVKGFDGNIYKTVSFDNNSYLGSSANNNRMMLNSLSISDEGTYVFYYNRNREFPNYGCIGQRDHWGYYNGDNHDHAIPNEAMTAAYRQFPEKYGSNATCTSYANKTPNINYGKTGILEKIVYPTGGQTTFSYSQNGYGEVGGGLKTDQISNYDNYGNLLQKRTFTYSGYATQDPPTTGLVYDTYHGYSGMATTTIYERYATCSSEPLVPLVDCNGISTFYDNVTETDLDNNQIRYHYIYGGILPAGNNLSQMPWPQFSYPNLNDEGACDPLLEYKTYCQGSTPIYTESYNYDIVRLDTFEIGLKTMNIVSVSEVYGQTRFLEMADIRHVPTPIARINGYIKTYRLNNKTTTDHQTGISTTESYTYDPLFRTLKPKSITVTGSDGKEIKTVNLYPFECSNSVCDGMYNQNIADQVVSSRQYVNGVLTKTDSTQFVHLNNYWFYPEYYYESILGGPMTEKWHLQDYDTSGNPRTITENGIDKTALVWGFKSSWPVAKVSGLSYGELQNMGLTSTLTSIAQDSIPSSMTGYLTTLRNGVGTNGLITTYNYKPLFGVSAITNENGYTTYYDYNTSDGKLSAIRDANGPLQQFSYQYVHPYNSSTTNSTNFVQTRDMLSTTQGKITCQYHDGLGRPVETATNVAGSYVYTMQNYDAKGRVSQEWLPSIGSTSLSYLSSISSISATTYSDSHAYSTNSYDALDRLTFTQTPGDAWYSASKGISKVYGTNTANSVKRYQASLTENSLIKSGYYAEKTLHMEKTTDEDGKVLTVFTDKLGRKVLERRGTGNDTYFVYDDLNQLRFVLSPEYQYAGYKNMYGYEYRYDEKGRMEKKILPQCEHTQYWYDMAGRIKFSQDATLRLKNLYRFMLYDKFGRLCVQGTCSTCWRGEAMNTVTCSTSGSGFQNTGYELSRPGDISGTVTIEVVNYYDNYNFLSRYTAYPLTQTPTATTTGLLTGTVQKASDGGNVLDAFYYDFKGRITANRSIKLSRLTTSTTSYNYWGAVSQTSQTTYPGLNTSATPLLTVTTTNSYNSTTGLLTNTALSVKAGSGSTTTRTVSSLIYDGLGRVKSNSRSGSAGSVNYTYNPQGWITRINGKGFSEWLHYADSIHPLYNGNISLQMWMAYGDTYNRGYQFSYDALNRLTNAVYGENNFGKHDNRYNEKVVEYSANGMIKRFQRRGLKDDGQYGKVDNLHISLDGNRPEKITDDADLQTVYGAMEFRDMADLPQEYYYDGCGSLVADANKGIAHIDYDNLNHPKRIQFTNGNTIEYVYAPDGQKLRATYQTAAGNVVVPLNTTQTITASTTSQTDYMGNVILSGTSSGSSANVSLNKFLFAGGYLSFPSSTTSAFHYYTQDHLGNNRAVVNESGTIEQITHYYPFGGFFADAGTGSSLQPYKYNGKELDRMHGLDLYDYGARHYDAIVPMFTQQDPLAEKYYGISPYAYCENNPISYIDEHGDSVAVLNMGYSLHNQHIALLIQNDKNEWQYYSFNGVPVYNKTNGLVGGGPHDNLGEKTFASPQEFLDSEYNTYEGSPKEKMGKDEINGYGYIEAYVIPTTQDQDNKIRSSFEKTVKNGYNLFTNHCGHAVQNALKSAGLGVSIRSFEKESFSYEDKVPYLPGNAFMYIKANNVGNSLFRRK